VEACERKEMMNLCTLLRRANTTSG
jgi:hypothetical protein